MSGAPHGSAASPFKQPKAVFAVAFACVVSFMGIGLVDPILPAISNQLHASPSETTLLFTSYLVVTAVAMLITNWVSSRIGAKWTLICRARPDRGVRRTGRVVRLDRLDHRVPRWLGRRERTVHRHLARGHRRFC